MFYIARGPADAQRFYQLAVAADPWVDDPDRAFLFECRADARHVAEMLMLAIRGEAVAVIATECPPASLERVAAEVQRQEHAGAMRGDLDRAIVDLHEAGALTRANVEGLGFALD